MSTPLSILQYNVFERTGVMEDDFMKLYFRIAPHLRKARRRTLSSKGRKTATYLHGTVRLLLVLHWLRHYPPYSILASLYDVSKSTVSREIHFIIPIVLANLNNIKWPKHWMKAVFEGVSGAIDCTPHYRYRVHPGQAEYYRRDHHSFSLTVQLICGLDGTIFSISIAKGHNNDQGVANATYVAERMFPFRLLADRGYSGCVFVKPDEVNKPCTWNNKQKALRSVVEVVFAYAKNWEVANQTFKQSPEFQAMCLIVVYQLAQLQIKQFPLRTSIPMQSS